MKASELLSEPPIPLKPTDTIDHAMEQMKQDRFRHLPVMCGDELVGMVHDRDVLVHVARASQPDRSPVRPAVGTEVTAASVSQIMSPAARPVRPGSNLDRVVELLITHRISALPVMEDTKLLGILTKRDLLRWYREFCENNPSHSLAASPVRLRMKHNVWTVQPGEPIRTAISKMAHAGVKHLPVLEGRKLVGIISDRDVRVALGVPVWEYVAGPGEEAHNEDTTSVEVIMTPHPRTVGPDDSMAEAVTIMLENRISALPTMATGTLVGILTDTDLAHLVRSLVMAPAA